MGGDISTETPSTLTDVQNIFRDKYSIKDLEIWYEEFEERYPFGYIPKLQLRKLYATFFPKGNDFEFANRNYKTLWPPHLI